MKPYWNRATSIGSQIICGCSCITIAEWRNCQKYLLSGPDQGIVCQHLFSMLSNSGKDREMEAGRRALWKSCDFPTTEMWKEHLNMSLALHPPPNWPKMAKGGSLDLSRPWSWDKEDTFEMEDSLATETWAEYQVSHVCQDEKIPTAKTKSASD